MKGKHIWSLLVSLLVTSAITVNTTYAIATFRMNPAASTAEPNETFSVTIQIADVTDLFAWATRIEFNATLLEATSVEEGPFLDGQPEGTQFVKVTDNTEGWVDIGCTTTGDYPGVSGAGTLATVTFKAKEIGMTALAYSYTELVDHFLQDIPVNVINGYFNNSPFGHDIAVTAVSVSPTTAPAGTIVTINVTIKNQGDFDETFNLTAYYSNIVIEEKPDISLNAGDETIISIYWNTTGITSGVHPIRAEVSDVLGETDTEDNEMTGESVTIPGHDIAIINVTNGGKTTIDAGEVVPISVTLKNEGNWPETFDVSVYYDDTNLIGTQTVTDLAAATQKQLTFSWDTAGVAAGVHLTKAKVPPLPGETDTKDNELACSWMNAITIRGEFQSLPFEYIVIAIIGLVAVVSVVGLFIARRRKAK